MVALETALAEAAYMVARQAEASSSISASETASNSDVASPTPSADDDDDDGGGGGATSSPLLFFVALGFGVVFTNLWYVPRMFFPVISSLDASGSFQFITSIYPPFSRPNLTSGQDHRWRQILLPL